MSKVWRQEVRQLKGARRSILKQFNTEIKQVKHDIADATREMNRLNRSRAKELCKLDRRIAILVGRLS